MIIMGLSFMALILLSARLHDVDREVTFIQHVLTSWLPSSLPANVTSKIMQELEGLRKEMMAFMMELTSARTTLILSVVFVSIYILSWWWMAFAINQAQEGGSVSLRTVLLLSVFAAVDIAASAGFVLLRIIMYIRRDRMYPYGLRTPRYTEEHDQLGALAALRLATLQSSCASTDILVIIVVGFLTLLRGYSVLCVISYYQKAKNSEKDNFVKDLMAASDATDITGESLKDMDEYIPRPLLMDYSKKLPTTLQRDRGERSVPATLRRERGGGVAPSVVSTIDGHNEVKIQASDMPVEMQKAAVSSAHQALQLYSTEKLIAESIKQDFDRLYQPTWHCIAGRNWGSCVTHSRRCYVRMACRDMTIMLYRST
ncbi:hypothetical protein LAZ67_3004827 [Cordylochernes scorpioides]|uniref:Uncharacterized protein n=1 Tax=Cordylochernes scorpioides TaxID=51811 RepID=A0ABY6KA58_9ARAC|nr:hypothetical protein LAZ67_3004827 [Cordylochernes scorpioides]